MLALDAQTLRGVGLSANKAASLLDLAEKTLDGTVVLEPRRLARESDEEVIERLSSVRSPSHQTPRRYSSYACGFAPVAATVRQGGGSGTFTIPLMALTISRSIAAMSVASRSKVSAHSRKDVEASNN